MTTASMRRVSRLSLSVNSFVSSRQPAQASSSLRPQTCPYSPRAFPPPATRPWQQKRRLADVRDPYNEPFAEAWFSSTQPCPVSEVLDSDSGWGSGPDHKPPDERTLKLGKTIRILHDRLPNILISPLPQGILSPSVTLRLFPSTHPHLPTVSGRIPYVAMLCSSPLAWGRVPLVGNVKLIILSERMVKNGGNEKLVVRWKTCEKSRRLNGHLHGAPQVDKIAEWLGQSSGREGEEEEDKDKDKEFLGLFIFEFDDVGRVVTHTIELADVGSNWETKTSRFVSVTDWLLGRAWSKKGEDEGGLALGYANIDERPRGRQEQLYGRRR